MKEFLKKTALFAVAAFAATVVIYWFNLENKLIYFGIRPLLNKIYDNRKRERRL